MSIRRGGNRPNDHYTIITNTLVRDQRLSFKARGIAAYLLSHTEGFRTTVATIAKANGVGLEQVQSGLRELEKLGYISREQPRDQQGRVQEIDYVITDYPGLSVNGKPDTGSDLGEQDPDQEVSAGHDRYRETRTRSTRVRPAQVHKKNRGLEEQLKEEQHPEEHADADASGADARRPSQPSPAQQQPSLFDDDVEPPGGDCGQPTSSKPVVEVEGCDVDRHETRSPEQPAESSPSRSAADHETEPPIVNPRRRRAPRQATPGPDTAHTQQSVTEWLAGWESTHGEVKPTRSMTARAGRAAKECLAAGNPLELVLAAARRAGAEGWPTIDQQLARMTSTAGQRTGRGSHTTYQQTGTDADYRRAVETGAIFR